MGLANSTDQKDHEELARLLLDAEQRVKLRKEKYDKITAQLQKTAKNITSIQQQRSAEMLRADTLEAKDAWEQAVFERNRKEKQLLHAMSHCAEAPVRSAQGLEILDTMRKYYYAQRQDKHMYKAPSAKSH